MEPETTVTEAVINQLVNDSYATAQEKGFWNPPNELVGTVNTKLLLIVSEVIEAMDVLRKPYEGVVDPFTEMTQEQGQDFIEELADVVIRTFDLAGSYQWNLGHIVLSKMEKNRSRPPKHGKRF